MGFGSALQAVAESPLSRRKGRGAFFTPQALADYIAKWAIRDGSERVLEPSCGEANFIFAAFDRLVELGLECDDAAKSIEGVEIHEDSVRAARRKLAMRGIHCSLEQGDFLDRDPSGEYDVVIGNPPYVRFQAIGESQWECVRKISRQSGVKLSSLSSLWAPFVVQSALFLGEGGRLGLVLPAELLSVNYAAPIRSFLLASFSSIQLVTFDALVFPEVQEEIVVLLADGYRKGSSNSIVWRQCSDLGDLDGFSGIDYLPDSQGDRWSALFASKDALGGLGSLLQERSFVDLDSWGKVSLGLVTGNNDYFALSEGRCEELGLEEGDCVLLCPPGSKHLRRFALTEDAMEEFSSEGKRTRLFSPHDRRPSSAALAYIEAGERAGVDTGYKCGKRTPWWRIPVGDVPDAFVTYMNGYGPSLCSNDVGAFALNSCHGLYLDSRFAALGRELLPLACMNSATLFGAEIVGRPYGGGVLKLEPKEAARLPVPSPSAVEAVADALRDVMPRAEKLMGLRDYDAVVSLVDAVFVSAMGGEREFLQMGSSAAAMRLRRKKRGCVARMPDAYKKYEEVIESYWESRGFKEGSQRPYWDSEQRPLVEIPLLEKLLEKSVADGDSARSGGLARALDMWIAEELRSAGFDGRAVWPRLHAPRALDPSILRFVETLDAITAESCCAALSRCSSCSANVLGAVYRKQIDVGLSNWMTGPEIMISTKTMSSSFGKNLSNRFEEAYGDAKNLKGRHPLATLGFFFLVNDDIVKEPGIFAKAIAMLEKLQMEDDAYDVVCLALVSFGEDGSSKMSDASRFVPQTLSVGHFFSEVVALTLLRSSSDGHAEVREKMGRGKSLLDVAEEG